MKREPLQAIAEALVIDLAHDGRGVARVDGKTVFIEGALPDERVRFSIVKRRRQFDEARLVAVLSAAPDRVAPRCAHFGICGGCSLQHLKAPAQLAAKQRQLLDNLERIGGTVPQEVLPPLTGPEWAYRRRARLGVRYVHKKGRVLAGFRERDKPYLADLKHCEVLLAPFGDLPAELAALTETLSIREQLPQVELAAGDGDAALVFRVMREPDAEDLEKIAAFAAARDVQVFLQPGGLDTVRPLQPGQPPLHYMLGGLTLEFGPVDFIQVNAGINSAMVEAAVRALEPEAEDSVLDLFCGLGNFTLPLAGKVRKVLGVEGDAALIARARHNARRNAVGNADFAIENLFEPEKFGAWSKRRYDSVLLDPPRAGAAAVMGRMREWQPRRVVYISCHPGSLARDAGTLVKDLGYKLRAAGVMDMFPHTTHVESIAVFEAQA